MSQDNPYYAKQGLLLRNQTNYAFWSLISNIYAIAITVAFSALVIYTAGKQLLNYFGVA